MPLDHYVTLGRSGLRVSPLCLGTLTFDDEGGWGSSVKDSEAILDRYSERGGNFIDTANVYNGGRSEKVIGDHLGRHSSRRDRTVIATKFFGNLYRGDPNGGGAGRKAIMAACEHSLRRLQTDYIDLYWMHWLDKHTPIEETLGAMDDLVTSGKVRYLGFSNTPAWKVAEAQMTARLRGTTPLTAIQVEYSLLERTVEGEILPMARHFGLGVTPWSPLRTGALTGKYTRENAGKQQATRGEWTMSALDERGYTVIDALLRIAKELDTTAARVAIAWLQAQAGVTSSIFGARTLAQLDDNLAALEVRLEPAHLAALDAVSKPTLGFPANYLGVPNNFGHAGATVNGEPSEAFPFVPKDDSERA